MNALETIKKLILVLDAATLVEQEGFPYEDRDGCRFKAFRPDELNARLRDIGWKNTSSMDSYWWKKLGFKIQKLQYVGGAYPTGRFIEVVTT